MTRTGQISNTALLREQELILCCAAALNDDAARAGLRRLAGQELNWTYVLKTAELHGMLPLLRARIDETCPDALPATVRSSLLRATLSNASHNLMLTGELIGILNALAAEGIDVVPFKGPVLADQVYGNVSMRQFCDLDVLVRPHDVLRARQVLIERGYQPEFNLSREREEEYVRAEHAFQLTKEETGFVVELHWSFGSKDQVFPLRAAEIWQRLQPRSLQGHSIQSLSNEDLLLYLCVHGAKHRWERLEWICSIAALLRAEKQMNWRRVAALAQRTGGLRGLRLGLLLANDICGVPLPPLLAGAALADRGARRLAEQVRGDLFLAQPVHRTREFKRQTFYLQTRERILDRFRIVWFSCARIPHPLAKDWDMFRLPASMSFLYYLLRPLRLFRDYGLRILQG